MSARLQLRSVSHDELTYRNLISACRVPIAFNWMGATWLFSLSPLTQTVKSRFQVEADWGGARMLVRADPVWIEQIGQNFLDGTEVAAVPDLVRLAILEAAFAQVSAQIEDATRKRFRIIASGTEPPDFTGLEGFGWQCESRGEAACGEVWLDPVGLGFLAMALRPAAGAPNDLQEWSGLPIPVRFSVGWVDLPTRTIAATMPRDVIMLDESWMQGENGLTVLLGRTSAFRAVLNGTTITVTEGLGDIMADMAETAMYDEEQTLDDVTIRLTFDLGERMVTLGELRSLAPGFTFDLGRDLRRAVTIRANAMPIGEGELVEIDGRVGVSVLTLTRFPE
ncbi:MAG: Type secretion inner rane protein YscQ [Herminiimonas sp.]|nr:Type secretion inner rane protein YscQ [Herminiimonas sp.]